MAPRAPPRRSRLLEELHEPSKGELDAVPHAREAVGDAADVASEGDDEARHHRSEHTEDQDRRQDGGHQPAERDARRPCLTFPFAWRRRLAQDGALLGALPRIFVETVHAFYARRAAIRGVVGAKTGAVTVVQRTSSDLRLNPHLHVVFLDGTYREQGGELASQELGRLSTREVGELLEQTVRRIKHLRRRGALDAEPESDELGEQGEQEARLAAPAVSGQAPPAGPQWVRGLGPRPRSALAFDKPLCASLDGFTLHAATRAGADARRNDSPPIE